MSARGDAVLGAVVLVLAATATLGAVVWMRSFEHVFVLPAVVASVGALLAPPGNAWQWHFTVTSDAHSFEWWSADEFVEVPDDVYYETSVRVSIPEEAPPGDYRLCTSGRESFCAPLKIREE